MLYSKLLGKTRREIPKDETSLNAQLLIRAGFIQKEMAGVYAFLPMGLRVLKKIIQIVREEMVEIGGQEIFLGSLQDPELWKATERWSDEEMDIWFKTRLKSNSELGLAITHEEPLTNLLSRHISSYKDLPLYLFQIQTKFRNELRAKNGLLRTREFVMKDLYSFNLNEKDFDDFYERAKDAYIKIFERLGLGDKTFLTFASGGTFSKYSHEFQTVCEAGEDTIYLDREKQIAVNKEVYEDTVLENLGLDKDKLEELSAIEVGNIFSLGTRFSDSLGLCYTDADDNEQPIVMGSYGIGIPRAMAAIAEVSNDDKGIIWPRNVTPFDIHLIGLEMDDADVEANVKDIYEKLVNAQVEVLFDDRKNVAPGEKFADADLVGIPLRVVVSQKTGRRIELKERDKSECVITDLLSLLNNVKS
jgi:prolyl-tRNA synthetase